MQRPPRATSTCHATSTCRTTDCERRGVRVREVLRGAVHGRCGCAGPSHALWPRSYVPSRPFIPHLTPHPVRPGSPARRSRPRCSHHTSPSAARRPKRQRERRNRWSRGQDTTISAGDGKGTRCDSQHPVVRGHPRRRGSTGWFVRQAGVFCVVINPSFVIGECMTKVRAL